MVATLRYQAEARRDDLLWEPVDAAEELAAVVDRVRPDHDHRRPPGVQRPARAGRARASRTPTWCSGTRPPCPSATRSTATRRRGRRRFAPDPDALAALRRCAARSGTPSPREWNAALRVLDPSAAASDDAFAEHGDLLLLNYPAELHDPSAPALLPPHAFLGSAVRGRGAGPEVDAWLAPAARPGRLRQLRQLPVGARRRAGTGRRSAATARRAGGAGERLRRRRDLGPIPPRLAGAASTCRRWRCWTGRR